jgi:hypothetical protein
LLNLQHTIDLVLPDCDWRANATRFI